MSARTYGGRLDGPVGILAVTVGNPAIRARPGQHYPPPWRGLKPVWEAWRHQ